MLGLANIFIYKYHALSFRYYFNKLVSEISDEDEVIAILLIYTNKYIIYQKNISYLSVFNISFIRIYAVISPKAFFCWFKCEWFDLSVMTLQ